jgi:hypothetical protein
MVTNKEIFNPKVMLQSSLPEDLYGGVEAFAGTRSFPGSAPNN